MLCMQQLSLYASDKEVSDSHAYMCLSASCRLLTNHLLQAYLQSSFEKKKLYDTYIDYLVHSKPEQNCGSRSFKANIRQI